MYPYEDDCWITINNYFPGIGDGILGLTAVKGLSEDCPNIKIEYRISYIAMVWVKFFDAGYHWLSLHNTPKPNVIEMNNFFEKDSTTCRWERYCTNVGASKPVLPVLRDYNKLLELGKKYKNLIVISPFSDWSDRTYNRWLEVEQLLLKMGYNTVIIDNRLDRGISFNGIKLFRVPPEEIIGAILNCKVFLGNDSGMSHLSGILGINTVVLCGPTRGEIIFGFYPKTYIIQGFDNYPDQIVNYLIDRKYI